MTGAFIRPRRIFQAEKGHLFFFVFLFSPAFYFLYCTIFLCLYQAKYRGLTALTIWSIIFRHSGVEKRHLARPITSRSWVRFPAPQPQKYPSIWTGIFVPRRRPGHRQFFSFRGQSPLWISWGIQAGAGGYLSAVDNNKKGHLRPFFALFKPNFPMRKANF